MASTQACEFLFRRTASVFSQRLERLSFPAAELYYPLIWQRCAHLPLQKAQKAQRTTSQWAARVAALTAWIPAAPANQPLGVRSGMALKGL